MWFVVCLSETTSTAWVRGVLGIWVEGIYIIFYSILLYYTVILYYAMLYVISPSRRFRAPENQPTAGNPL